MRIFAIGWGKYVENQRFSIDVDGTATIEKIGPEIKKELQKRLSNGVFEYIYRTIKIFTKARDFRDGVIEVTSNADLRGVSDLIIMPGKQSYEEFLTEASEKRSNLIYHDAKQRFFSLVALFGIVNEYEKDQKKIIGEMFKLGNIGFFGCQSDETDENEMNVRCIHCYEKTRVLKTLSFDEIRIKHMAESKSCIMIDQLTARNTCDEREKIENYYTSQLAFTTRVMLRQSHRADYYAKTRFEERRALFENARYPRLNEVSDNPKYDCSICGIQHANIISVPCYHLASCNACFLRMKEINDDANDSRGEDEPELKLRCPLCNSEPLLFTRVYGGSEI